MYHDLWAMVLARKFERHCLAEGYEPTAAYDLRAAAFHVSSIAAEILGRHEAEPPPQALAPVVIGRLLETTSDPLPALRICRDFSLDFLDLVRTHGSEAVPQSYPAFVLAPDSRALPLGNEVDVCLVARWTLDDGRQVNLAVLTLQGRMSSAALTWRRSDENLRISLDQPIRGLEALDTYRIGHGRVRPLLDRVARSRETTISRLETMLRVGERFHAEMSRIGYLTPVLRVSKAAGLERAIDEIEAGKTLGHVDAVAGNRAFN